MCTLSHVNEATKRKIAAYGASFRKATKSPFGAEDEIGMLNLIDAESRRAIVSRADAGKAFDLSVDHFNGMPGWADAKEPVFRITMTNTPSSGEVTTAMRAGCPDPDLVSFSSDSVAMFTHCGTHIDTLSHFGYHGVIFNNHSAARQIGEHHWKVAGADKLPPIIARGVLLDLAGLLGVDMLPPSYGIGSKDLQDCLKHQKIELRPGDVVLIRTGRMRAWPDIDRFIRDAPGLNLDGARALAEAGAITVAGDNHALEHFPVDDPENWQPVHTFLLAQAGIPIMEIVNLEELAGEQLYEFLFFGACIRFRGATGAPMRPVAIPLMT